MPARQSSVTVTVVAMGMRPMAGVLWLALLLTGAATPAAAQTMGTHEAVSPAASWPDWLRPSAQERMRLDSDRWLQRARVGLTVTGRGWFSAMLEAQDARAFHSATQDGTLRDVTDLRQAWVAVGGGRQVATLKVGRQKLAFGSERMLGGAEWANTARVFDAARLTLRRRAFHLDAFAAALVVNNPDDWDHHQSDPVMLGVYGSLDTLLPGSAIEPYMVFRRRTRAAGDLGDSGASRVTTAGVRTAGRARAVWTYEVDAQLQRGPVASSRQRAWAATVQAQRSFPGHRGSPSLLLEGNYASGDRRRGDSIVGSLDQLFPTNHGIYGVADRIARRNALNARAGMAVRPWSRATLKLEGHTFHLASRADALYAASGQVAVAAVPGGATTGHVGEEVDVIADVKWSTHIDIGAQFGVLRRGPFLRAYDRARPAPFYCLFIDLHL